MWFSIKVWEERLRQNYTNNLRQLYLHNKNKSRTGHNTISWSLLPGTPGWPYILGKFAIQPWKCGVSYSTWKAFLAYNRASQMDWPQKFQQHLNYPTKVGPCSHLPRLQTNVQPFSSTRSSGHLVTPKSKCLRWCQESRTITSLCPGARSPKSSWGQMTT